MTSTGISMKHITWLNPALLMLLLLPDWAMAAPPSVQEAGAFLPQLAIYAAKGPPDSCGPGCDRWIAIEGKIEPGAAARVERFFRERKDTQRPIYFSSPGGEMRDSLAIGRLLRGRKVIGRVGRTVVDACPGTQTDDACTLIKTTRDEVVASLTTHGAVCGSACTFLLFGAVTREVAPDAAVAVHGPKVWMEFRLNVNEKRREEAIAKAHGEAERLAYAYVEEMGISRELIALAVSISHENLQVLTRQELYRFRIDTRDFVESAWRLEKAPRPSVRKMAQVRTSDGFRRLEWQLLCESNMHARMVFAYELGKDAAAVRIVAMTAGSAKPPQFSRFPVRFGGYEGWSAIITPDTMKSLFAVSRLGMGQSTLLPDGRATSSFFEIETRGLESAWTKLSAICRAAQAKAPGVKWPLQPALPQLPPQVSEGLPSRPAPTK
jgi:hypothetical protein